MISLIKRVSGGNHVRKCISRILDHRDLSIDSYFQDDLFSFTCKSEKSKLIEEEESKKFSPLLSCGWQIHPYKDAIYKEFIFHDFIEAFMFLTRVDWQIKKINFPFHDYYSEWINIYNRVTFILTTHDVRLHKLSRMDVELATWIDETANARRYAVAQK